MISDSAHLRPPAPGRAVRFPHRLLAEAVAALETGGGTAGLDREAVTAAVEGGGDLERRIVVRAHRLPASEALGLAIRRIDLLTRVVAAVLLLLAAIAGASLARTVLGPGRAEPVNPVWVLISMLGVQTAMLVLWAALLVLRPGRRGANVLGGLVAAVSGGLARLAAGAIGRDRADDASDGRRVTLAALRAIGRSTLRPSAARWWTSSVSHATWASFNVGLLIALLVMLSGRHYVFAWETTILPEGVVPPVVRGLAWAPGLVGLEGPGDAMVEGTRWPGEPDVVRDARGPWSALLIGSALLYGLAPRLALLAMSWALLARARRRHRLDLADPSFARLRARLLPGARSLGVVDPEGPDEHRRLRVEPAAGAEADRRPATGSPAFVGLELEPPASGWPPPLAGDAMVDAEDLGSIDGRAERRRVVETLASAEIAPAALLVVADLTATPDRGLAATLAALDAAAPSRTLLLLTGGQRLRDRLDRDDAAVRIEDWRALAVDVGLAAGRILEIDLDHLTDASSAAIVAAIENDGPAPEVSPASDQARLEACLDLVEAAVDAWTAPVELADQAELHRRIWSVHRTSGAGAGRRGVLAWPPAADPGRLAPDRLLEDGRVRARQLQDLLPDRLRAESRWVVAGASAGILGCLAAAAVASPLAIAALPSWGLVGGAIAGLARLGRAARNSTDDPAADEPAPADDAPIEGLDAAVRSAATLAVVLHAQGRGEAAVTDALDRAFPAEADEPLLDRAAARRWLAAARRAMLDHPGNPAAGALGGARS